MAGMIGFGRNLSKQAGAGFSEVARGEQQRNSTNQAISDAESAEKKQMIGMGLGLAGSMYLSGGGMAALASNPVGWAIGGGLLLASLF